MNAQPPRPDLAGPAVQSPDGWPAGAPLPPAPYRPAGYQPYVGPYQPSNPQELPAEPAGQVVPGGPTDSLVVPSAWGGPGALGGQGLPVAKPIWSARRTAAAVLAAIAIASVTAVGVSYADTGSGSGAGFNRGPAGGPFGGGGFGPRQRFGGNGQFGNGQLGNGQVGGTQLGPGSGPLTGGTGTGG